MFSGHTTIVLTKSTFGADFGHRLSNGWVLSNPMVGISKPSFFGDDISRFLSDPYPNRLAFDVTGDLLLQAALLRPELSVTYFGGGGLFAQPQVLQFGYPQPPLAFMGKNGLLCERNRAALAIIESLVPKEQHTVSAILELKAAHLDDRVRPLGYVTRGSRGLHLL
jgi:hypothetical protein